VKFQLNFGGGLFNDFYWLINMFRNKNNGE
jgi:hypothetical protein